MLLLGGACACKFHCFVCSVYLVAVKVSIVKDIQIYFLLQYILDST